MISKLKKLRKTTIRARMVTKQKLLDAIYEDFLYNLMTAKLFTKYALNMYENNLTIPSNIALLSNPYDIDFSSQFLSLKSSDKIYSLVEEKNNGFAKEILEYSLGINLIWGFEEFEVFLKRIYAFVGFMDKTNWQGGDFENKVLKDIKFKEYEEYLSSVNKNKKLSSYSEIVKRLRKLYPQIEKWESNGISQYENLHWKIAYIAKLRHLLVHRSGAVEDRNKFVGNLEDEFGLKNNDEFTKFLSLMNSNYLQFYKARLYISLYDSNKTSINTHKCDYLFNVLQIYARLICEAIKFEFLDRNI